MLEEAIRADRLSQVIEHTTAPAFLLGAIAAFLAMMLNRVSNLMRPTENGEARHAHDHLLLLKHRVRLLNRAIFFALCAAIAPPALLITSFLFSFLGLTHVYGMGLLFLVSFAFLIFALLLFAQEIRIVIKENDGIG